MKLTQVSASRATANRSKAFLLSFAHRSPVVSFAFFLLLLIASGEASMAEDAVVGFTEPLRTIELAASETGSLSELNVKPGDRVTAESQR